MMTGPHTPEARARIGATLKGRKRPPEVCEKIAATKTGKKLKAEHRLSLRVGQRVIKLFKPEIYEAMRERSRARMTANMQDPAFLERWRAGREKYRASRAGREDPAIQAALDRQQEIADMRATGATFKEIGRRFGISMNRAYALNRKYLARVASADDGLRTAGAVNHGGRQ